MSSNENGSTMNNLGTGLTVQQLQADAAKSYAAHQAQQQASQGQAQTNPLDGVNLTSYPGQGGF